jgi:hypothetical protein
MYFSKNLFSKRTSCDYEENTGLFYSTSTVFKEQGTIVKFYLKESLLYLLLFNYKSSDIYNFF